MKYKIYLLYIVLICTLPIFGMQNKKRRRNNLNQNSLELTNVLPFDLLTQPIVPYPQQPQSIIIHHNIPKSQVSLIYSPYNNPQKQHLTSILVLKKGFTPIPFDSSFGPPILMRLILPTSPQNVYLSIDTILINHGNILDIENANKIIVIKNKTTQQELLQLPLKSSFLHIGQKANYLFNKTITIHNINATLVKVKNIAQREPLHISNIPASPIVKGSKLLASQIFNLRNNEYVVVKTQTLIDNPNIIASFVTLQIKSALQKIKIFPTDDVIQNNDVLSITYNDKDFSFYITNQNNEQIARIYTSANSVTIQST
jgi:hypothetical protein